MFSPMVMGNAESSWDYYVESQPLGRVDDEVVSMDLLRVALRRKLDERGMDDSQIDDLASYLLNFFGYSDHIIDNMLSSSDRNIFYMLEEESLLETFKEEVYLLKGRMWRIHYWRLRMEELRRLGTTSVVVPPVIPEDPYSVYSQMSDDVWRTAREY